MNSEKINPLLSLFAAGIENIIVGELFDGFFDDHFIQRDGSQRDRAMLDQVTPAPIHVTARRKDHHRISPVFQSHVKLVQFAFLIGRQWRSTKVGVDLGRNGSADPNWF